MTFQGQNFNTGSLSLIVKCLNVKCLNVICPLGQRFYGIVADGLQVSPRLENNSMKCSIFISHSPAVLQHFQCNQKHFKPGTFPVREMSFFKEQVVKKRTAAISDIKAQECYFMDSLLVHPRGERI